MSERTGWQFSDDRGQLSSAGRRPSRVLAYVQAGATLWDHGIRPSGIFGSDHDGESPDRAKTGSLPLTEVDYLGAGSVLDVDTLLRGGPDLVVAVSYGGGRVYGLAPETAKHLEEHVPVVVIDVGQARTLGDIGDRFAELARSLGAEEGGAAAAYDLEAARERLRTLAAGPFRPRVLALSPAEQDQAHLARPRMWPELRVLAELGVDVLEPVAGPGANWSTVGWAEAAALRPRILLTDIRSNATPLDRLRSNAGWTALERAAAVVPWNPEPVCSPQAHTRFLTLVADAMEAAQGR
ncbi:ABC transporter substrate-binding protein [Streptomyces sp. NPDC056352]|uniref:ABC transporter substrate-binding protein n=1 Tax=Streptomyces sp. NPDC056352 TaxID=3345791 RepID=UPI0035E3A7C2